MTSGGENLLAAVFPLLVVLSPFLPLIIHLAVSRGRGLYRDRALRQKGAIVSVIAGLIPLAGLFSAAAIIGGSPDWFWRIAYLLGVYILFGYVYFHIFNMSETARRIRILAHGHRDGKVIVEELKQNYTRKEMVEIRVARLLALGELRRQDSRYYRGRGILLQPARAVFSFRGLIFPDQIRPDEDESPGRDRVDGTMPNNDNKPDNRDNRHL